MVQALIDKAEILIEALPYIQRFRNKTVVIKYGGSAMLEEPLRASFAIDVVMLKMIGVRPVVVHGGGPQIGQTLERLGIPTRFENGLRVTDDATMEVVEMVLGGRVNREIVNLVNQGGGEAVGLTGTDAGLLRVRKRQPDGVDLGRVGEVIGVNPHAVRAANDAGFIPVVAPIGTDSDGLSYNVNADEAAGALAEALGAEKLILLTDVEGVLDSAGSLIAQLTESEVAKHLEEGTIAGGMIPKVECCLRALRAGVARSHIVDGRVLHAILLEVFTDGGVGTLLTR